MNEFFLPLDGGRPRRERIKETQDWNMMQPDLTCTSNCPYEPIVQEFTSNMDWTWPKSRN